MVVKWKYNGHEKHMKKVRRYLRGTDFDEKLRILENSKSVYTIVVSEDLSNSFDMESRTIILNPYEAIITEGGGQSPAIQWHHELGHAVQYDQNSRQYVSDQKREIQNVRCI